MTDLLVGAGEVGSALLAVLSERREFAVHDPPKNIIAKHLQDGYDWCHICIPYSDLFIETVSLIVKEYDVKHLINHSTVPVGTTAKLVREIDYIPTYYSPVRGRHPNLTEAVRKFPKWYASFMRGQEDNEVEAYYAEAGVQSRKAPNYEILELMKLLETGTYGYNLVLWQEIERMVKLIPGDPKLNLGMMKSWLYEKRKAYDGDLGIVPIYDLVPGPVGGHCIFPNIELLKERMTPELYAWLIKSNELRKS